jgi:hypothetical protein
MPEAQVDPLITNRPSPPKTKIASQVDKPLREVHAVLAGKGGIGKTLVASLLAQYLREVDRPLVCLDTDPVNRSLVGFAALDAKPIELLTKDQLNIRGVDQLIESVLTEDTNFVIDNGASSFLPFGRYMVETDVPGLIQAHGKKLVVHSVVAGGGAVAETLHGLEVLAASMPAARLIVWINEYFGPVLLRDKPFEEMQIYQQHRGRMTGIIRLAPLDPLQSPSVRRMLDARRTFAEALGSTDFLIAEKQRLTMLRRAIWDQLAPVI